MAEASAAAKKKDGPVVHSIADLGLSHPNLNTTCFDTYKM
jgi:hypothetical protein